MGDKRLANYFFNFLMKMLASFKEYAVNMVLPNIIRVIYAITILKR